MKERYLNIMDRVVDAYSLERIDAYIEKAHTTGITEHGFPRLCANIGILMAHGRKLHLKDRFLEMMELCCRQMPECGNGLGTRGNDFSVREIVCCILELEQAKLFPKESLDRWKQAMAAIDPTRCYRMVAPCPPTPVDNWGAFNAASEQVRIYAGLAQTQAYVENQVASQMFSFDENGMYRDPNDPVVYDVVTREVLATILYFGYNGKYKPQLEQHLRKAARYTLLMQSVTGEMPYGGRSNQFLHNEAHIALCMEYEAMRQKQLGDPDAAGQYKAAAQLAVSNIELWLDQAPGQHVKNYFPIESKIGCEKYAYYDKYMVTIASFLYLAYLFCDDTIEPGVCPAAAPGGHTWVTSPAFRKLFCKFGPYFLEAETKADPHYDAAGIGRIHRAGAPSAICLSVPASTDPKYHIAEPNPIPLSICCGAEEQEGWFYGSDENSCFRVLSHGSDTEKAFAELSCTLPTGKELAQTITVTKDGVRLEVSGDGKLGLLLPALEFDGKTHACINGEENTLTVTYKGWRCRYHANGRILDTENRCTNRNGIYRVYRAETTNTLRVNITIDPIS